MFHVKPTDANYRQSLADELAALDCTTDESRRFRDIALRLIELHQHQSVSIGMAVKMMVARNKLLQHAIQVMPSIAQAIESSEDYYENDENSRKLGEARSSLLALLRLFRNEV